MTSAVKPSSATPVSQSTRRRPDEHQACAREVAAKTTTVATVSTLRECPWTSGYGTSSAITAATRHHNQRGVTVTVTGIVTVVAAGEDHAARRRPHSDHW